MDPQIEACLLGPSPFEQLRSLAQDLLNRAESRAAILALLEQARQHLRQEGREADENVLLEVMDLLVGWCSPHAQLSDPGHGRLAE